MRVFPSSLRFRDLRRSVLHRIDMDEVAGSSPAPPTSDGREAPFRRLNPFFPLPRRRGGRVRGLGGLGEVTLTSYFFFVGRETTAPAGRHRIRASAGTDRG